MSKKAPTEQFPDEAGPSTYWSDEPPEEDNLSEVFRTINEQRDGMEDRLSPCQNLSDESSEPPAIESIENVGDPKGFTFADWVSMIGPRTEIKNRMKHYLQLHCRAKIREMLCHSKVIILYVCM